MFQNGLRHNDNTLNPEDCGGGIRSSWIIETVDKKSRSHVVTASLALDAIGNPHIAYNMESPNGDFVKYASWDGHSWKIEEATVAAMSILLWTLTTTHILPL